MSPRMRSVQALKMLFIRCPGTIEIICHLEACGQPQNFPFQLSKDHEQSWNVTRQAVQPGELLYFAAINPFTSTITIASLKKIIYVLSRLADYINFGPK